MGDYNPYDDTDFTQVEMVEMAMGNPVGEPGMALKENQFNLTKIQAHLITDALSKYDGYESDMEREVAQRTQRIIREKFDI